MLPSSTRAGRPDAIDRVHRTWLSVVLLVAAYVLILALGDTRAGLGSDSGGKLATAQVMADGGRPSPDVGYWAEGLDPEGRFHPLVNTVAVGDRWVQATSIPYSLATAELWAWAGAAGVAGLSMAGGVAAALAARRLARRVGGDGRLAFWVVGLGTPLAVYATDAWEHAPAMGLALWGLVFALEAESPAWAMAAGASLGGAVLLRAEVGAYVIAFALAALAVPVVRRRWTRHPSRVAAATAGLVGLVAGNAVLERLLLESGVRDTRAASGAADAGLDLGRRATDAVLTGTGLFADESAGALAVGLLLAAGLVVLGLRVARVPWVSERVARVAGGLVVALYLLRLIDGWAFVPGLLAAAPVVVLAVAVPRTAEVRVLLGTALGAVPLVWALQWKGNHIAQWGGRYLLLTTVLLAVVAVAGLSGRGLQPWPSRLLLGLTVTVTLAGVAWHVQRTDVVGGAGVALADLPPDTVVVSSQLHLGRELGSWYGAHRWLSAEPGTLDDALGIAREVGPEQIAVVDRQMSGAEGPPVPVVDGYELAEERTIPYLGSDLEVRILVRR